MMALSAKEHFEIRCMILGPIRGRIDFQVCVFLGLTQAPGPSTSVSLR